MSAIRRGYTATDILARYRRSARFQCAAPDGLGTPLACRRNNTRSARGQHPRQTTETNIAVFKRQIKSLGFSYDWSRELDTTDPKYFKWTQWIFLKLYNLVQSRDEQGRADRIAARRASKPTPTAIGSPT